MAFNWKKIGPGALVAAAFIGPGTVTTATIAGASYGYTLLWAILFSLAATFFLQEMAARLGIAAQKGLGEAVRLQFQNPILKWTAIGLILGAILIGNAAYEAGNISGAVLGFDQFSVPKSGLVLGIGILAFILLWTGRFRVIEGFLIGLVALMGLVFLNTAWLTQPDWSAVWQGMFNAEIPPDALPLVLGLIGTTVVPYNLFLHASSVRQRGFTEEDLSASRWDTLLSILIGGLITMAILITAAGAYAGSGQVIESSADLAGQLKPLLGDAAPWVLAIGFLAAGLSSAITAPLAAAFATSELFDWGSDLTSSRFRWIWSIVLLCGILFSLLGFKPTAVILFAQIANGLLLPIIAGFLWWILNNRSLLGEHVNTWYQNMAAGLILIVTVGLGAKSIAYAFGWL
ncbi:MAG: Nramp family divalent metal transporter [Bacteroidota bacterium]